LNDLGWLAEDKQEYAAASQYYNESLAIFRQIANRHSIANTLTNLSFVYLTLYDWSNALNTLQEALALARDLAATLIMLELLVGFARLRYLEGDWPFAANLLGMITAHPQLHDDGKTRIAAFLPELERQLGPEEINRLMEQGRALVMADVVRDLVN
ncbi:MAG: hypothetical protein H7Y09_14810, partial [Chitinophagaceae bacterium]|nr:hypothetical protein [Anaerolineae bacterium]